jgi:hypothetical protein
MSVKSFSAFDAAMLAIPLDLRFSFCELSLIPELTPGDRGWSIDSGPSHGSQWNVTENCMLMFDLAASRHLPGKLLHATNNDGPDSRFYRHTRMSRKFRGIIFWTK